MGAVKRLLTDEQAAASERYHLLKRAEYLAGRAAPLRRQLLAEWAPTAAMLAYCIEMLDECGRCYDALGNPVAAREARRQAATLRKVRGA